MKSPFKFLDPYDRGDKAIFFGRDVEIEDLYRLVFEASLVLVYGQSGTGKTSLIQCGLANRLQPTDWFELFARRQDDIRLSLDREVRARATTEIPAGAPIEEAVRSLYLDHLRPIYLIFDQFEELFILGTAEEQDGFIDSVVRLLASNASCKIIISLREEYLASLHPFERKLPGLFNKRLRVEPMSMTNVRAVITGTTAALGIKLEHGDDTAQKMIDKLEDPRAGVQLAYLQVYLDRLYRAAAADGSGTIVFTDEMVDQAGELGDILEQFLEEQSDAIQARVAANYPGIKKDAVQQVLEAFVTVDATKQPIAQADLRKQLPDLEAALADILTALQAARILRSENDLLELTHDSLAARIAERRSAERKSLLLMQKMVRDRLAAFEPGHHYLNRDELASIRRDLPRLGLNDAEQDFVRKSNRAARFGFVWRVGRWFMLPILILIGALSYLWADMDTQEAVVRAHEDTEKLARSIYAQLEPLPNSRPIRENLLKQAASIHAELDSSHGDEEPDRFWRLLYAADASRETGEMARARQRYDQLVDFVEQQGPDYGDSMLALVKLRILYARMGEIEKDPARKRALDLKMVDILYKGASQSTSYASFGTDLETLCDTLRASGPVPPDCNSTP